jgi:hypothetical protein
LTFGDALFANKLESTSVTSDALLLRSNNELHVFAEDEKDSAWRDENASENRVQKEAAATAMAS